MEIAEPQVEQFLIRPVSPFHRLGLRHLDALAQRFESSHIALIVGRRLYTGAVPLDTLEVLIRAAVSPR
jgi:hypothetical protein